MIQHLNGLLQPQSGQYFFEGQDIWSKKYDLKKLRQKVALCFQYPEYQLFEETILKDIAFGPKNLGFDKKKCEEKARYAMKLVGLPAELEKVSPFSLSGGQKRRVALAGILAMEPEYLILDEPVAGMDAPGKRMLFQLLHHLNKDKGITIVLVSHNMDDVAAHADRVLIMEDGTLKMDGTTREIFARKNDLTTMGLGIPQTVEFYLELRKMQIQESIDSNRQTLQNENAIPLTIEELAECMQDGYEAYLLFVIQMKDVRKFQPNWNTHHRFGDALKAAREAGVRILAMDCMIGEDFMRIQDPVEVDLEETDAE